jgi:hypothetical protein
MKTWSVEALCAPGRSLENPIGGTTLGALCNISSTMKSGADDILVARLIERSRAQLVVHPPAADGPITVNPLMYRAVIRPRDLLDDGAIHPSSRYVFWPYKETEDDAFELLSEKEWKSICPATWSYLRCHRDVLEARRDSGRTWKEHGREWYSLARIGKPSDYQPTKLLSPGEFREPRFSISTDASLFPCARIIGISSIQVPWIGLRAFLGSTFSKAWLRANLPPKGGGFRGMSVGNLSRLPVPASTETLWKELTDAAGTEVDKLVNRWLGDPHEAIALTSTAR